MSTGQSIGDERYVLVAQANGYVVKRQILCEGGAEHSWDESALDWVSTPGHWQTVSTSEWFGSRECARYYMEKKA